MPEEERALIMLVEESWALVSGGNDLQDLGVKAFLKIFEIAPGAVELFSFQGESHTRFRAKREQDERFSGLLSEGQGQIFHLGYIFCAEFARQRCFRCWGFHALALPLCGLRGVRSPSNLREVWASFCLKEP